MKYALFLLVTLLSTFPLLATDETTTTIRRSYVVENGKMLLYGQGTEGRMYNYYVDAQELTKLPVWVPETSDPPLSIAKAITIAIEAVTADNPTFDSLRVSQIQLMAIQSGEEKRHWFYMVSLFSTTGGEATLQMDANVMVIVLMNGSVVKPVLEKSKSR